MTERRIYVPRSYQAPMTNHILDVPRCAVWADMGLGKGVATLTALDALFLVGESYPALVLGPKRVARDVWPNEAAKWHHLRNISTQAILGTPAERIRALKIDASVHTINYENLEWLVDHWGKRWPYKIVVSDESPKLKSYRGSIRTSKNGKQYVQGAGGMRARALARIAHTKIKRFIELTGTPAPNGLKDLWGQMWFLDAGQRLGHTFDGFKQRWFTGSFDGHSLDPLPFAEEQIQEAVRDLCLTVVLDVKLEKPRVNNIVVKLPARARKIYQAMEKEMFALIDGHEIEAFGAAARTQKCLQLANGAAYTGSPDDPGPRGWVNVHDAKLEALESIVNEANGAPMLVSYEFKSDKARILKAFPQAVDISTPAGEQAFRRGGKILGLAHPASMGHGIEGLQEVCHIITHFGHNWALDLYDQINGRIGEVRQYQSGYDCRVVHNHIIAEDTVDELVMLRRDTKRQVQDILIDACRRYKGVHYV